MPSRALRTPLCLAALLSALLGACGGGGANAPLSPTSYPSITITPFSISTPPQAGVEAQFEGGICGGGNGQLTATWNFGDNTPTAHTGTHTYAQAGWFPLWVQCTDTSGSPWATVKGDIHVLP